MAIIDVVQAEATQYLGGIGALDRLNQQQTQGLTCEFHQYDEGARLGVTLSWTNTETGEEKNLSVSDWQYPTKKDIKSIILETDLENMVFPARYFVLDWDGHEVMMTTYYFGPTCTSSGEFLTPTPFLTISSRNGQHTVLPPRERPSGELAISPEPMTRIGAERILSIHGIIRRNEDPVEVFTALPFIDESGLLRMRGTIQNLDRTIERTSTAIGAPYLFEDIDPLSGADDISDGPVSPQLLFQSTRRSLRRGPSVYSVIGGMAALFNHQSPGQPASPGDMKPESPFDTTKGNML